MEDPWQVMRERVDLIRESYIRGQVGEAEASRQLGELTLPDSQGVLWSIGVQSGRWYRKSSRGWRRARRGPTTIKEGASLPAMVLPGSIMPADYLPPDPTGLLEPAGPPPVARVGSTGIEDIVGFKPARRGHQDAADLGLTVADIVGEEGTEEDRNRP